LLGKLLKFFVIDAGKCIGPLPPGETLFQNGDTESIQNAFCCGVANLQHGFPWQWWRETLSRVNYKLGEFS
jgi:hypothetical protein